MVFVKKKTVFFLLQKMYCVIMYIMYAHFQITIVVLFIESQTFTY